MRPAFFQIYNASAGSGKTYSLVKSYLSILLGRKHLDSFKQILAITFTNKAVNEMKERVLSNLHEFSKEEILMEPTSIFLDLQEELQLDAVELHQRARKILNRILYNYAFFDILTIDKFNHRLIRTFAFDLKLSTNFEVSLDEKALQAEAVDNLIHKTGTNKDLTKVLVDYALSKADQDKSWDISRDLREIAELLSKEDHAEYIKLLEDKPLGFFSDLGGNLLTQIKTLEDQTVRSAQELLDLFASEGIDESGFSGKYLYKQLKKIVAKKFENKWNYAWYKNIEAKQLYANAFATNQPDKAAFLDQIQPQIIQVMHGLKKANVQIFFLKNFHKNLIPLSLLNAINAELNTIKKEKNVLLISEFNKLISTTIADQPAPFIYERIGEKYKHYFIDEFQDTSILQWQNLKPLVSNALETELPNGNTGSILIVGDAKQAIYRWRGGKAEQFIDLYNEQVASPFQAPKTVENLPKNYRSYDQIINFNNGFFKFISKHLEHPTYRALFEEHSSQQTNDKKGGYLNFSFIDHNDNKESEDDLYHLKTQEIIAQAKHQGFNFGDICILTRKNQDGYSLADYLTQQGIPIISSESLLLNNNRKIAFLIKVLQHLITPHDFEINYQILLYLAEKQTKEGVHSFIQHNLSDLSAVLEQYNFKEETFLELPLYTAVEYAITQFKLAAQSDAYLQFFLDEVLNYTQNNNGSLSDFLAYWDLNKTHLSLAAPEDSDAVRILSIHKSKGLEFPVVIFPYANTDTQRLKNDLTWLPVDQQVYGIPYALFDQMSTIETSSELGAQLIEQTKEVLRLDNYNLLYVTLTRAVEQLYVVCKRDATDKGANTKTFAGLFISYLQHLGIWSESSSTFSIGEAKRVSKEKKNNDAVEMIPFHSKMSWNNSFEIITKAGSLWGTALEKAIDRGNLYHFLLSKIIHKTDIDSTVTLAINNGLLSENDKDKVVKYLLELVDNPKLNTFFTNNFEIYIERDLYTQEGVVLRPDRFMVNGNTAHIIDYKTGTPSHQHRIQIETYAKALSQIGYEVERKLIVYINEEIKILET